MPPSNPNKASLFGWLRTNKGRTMLVALIFWLALVLAILTTYYEMGHDR